MISYVLKRGSCRVTEKMCRSDQKKSTCNLFHSRKLCRLDGCRHMGDVNLFALRAGSPAARAAGHLHIDKL